jgi:MFS family permease
VTDTAGRAPVARPSTFRSLRHRNARLFLGGLFVSQIGAWVQYTALAIVVDRLTGSTTAIGVLTALQFGPLLLLGAWAGAFADRVDRRRIVLVTQSLLALQAVALALADLVDLLNVGVIYTLTLVLGIVSAIDNPARRGFVIQLVDQHEISNAMSLNTATMTGSRIFGPAIAALLITRVGTGWLFALNAVTSIAIIYSILAVDRSRVHEAPKASPGGRPIRDALAYIRATPRLGATFVVFAVVSTFGYNHNVSLPRIANEIWRNEQWFGWVMTVISLGSMIGSLMTASRPSVSMRWMAGNGLILGLSGLALAWTPSGWVALVVAVPLGLGGAAFIASMNSFSQQECPPEMRGRILAFIAIAFLGSYPIGGPITGIVGDLIGLEWSIAYGAAITTLAVLWLVARVVPRSQVRVATGASVG